MPTALRLHQGFTDTHTTERGTHRNVADLSLVQNTEHTRVTRKFTRITVSAMILIVAIFVLGERNDAVALISVLYYVNLILNFCFACAQFRKQSLMAIGLCLFIISDTILGLSFLDPYLTLKNHSVLDFIIHSGFDFIWAFYIPAQILLVFSLLPKHWRKI